MIWPFRSKRQKEDAFMDDVSAAVSLCSDKWLFFCKTLVFKYSVPLKDRIASFAFPMMEGLKNRFRSMKDEPDALLFMVILMGVVESGTHSKKEFEEELGLDLPDYP